MMKNILILTFWCISLKAFSCELSLPSHILKLQENLKITDFNASTNCQSKQVENILNKLSKIEGKVLTQALETAHITLKPRSIQVTSLESILNDKLLKNQDLRFFSARTLMNKSFLSLNDSFQFQCSDCDTPGEKRINLRDSNNKLIVVTANLKRKATYLVAARDISPYDNDLHFNDFITKTDYIAASTTPFATDLRVEFFKTSRFIKKGQIIENNMLLAKNLVRMGSKVSVFFKSEDVSIKASAVARRSGKYGDYIELLNPNSNKKITAKIIDFNKAIVDL